MTDETAAGSSVGGPAVAILINSNGQSYEYSY